MNYDKKVVEFMKNRNCFVIQFKEQLRKHIIPIHPKDNQVKLENLYLEPFCILGNICYRLYTCGGVSIEFNGWIANGIDDIPYDAIDENNKSKYDEGDYFLFLDLSKNDMAKLKLIV